MSTFRRLKSRSPWSPYRRMEKNRFEPNHALAMALTKQQVQAHLPLTFEESIRYMKGETLQTNGDRGWILITIDGYPLGWGKEVKEW